VHTLAELQRGNIRPEDLGPEKRLRLAEGLTEFPREIFALAEHIEVLDMSGNQISSLPDDFGRFKNLKIVFFADNHFDHVPEVLAQCKKLEMVGFKNNRIERFCESALPDSVHWLILTGNRINALPENFGRLTRLRKLALAGNDIQTLPDSMANCQALELIRLSANQLTHLPDWLFQLPKLAWLALAGNPVTRSSPLTQKSDQQKNVQTLCQQDFAVLTPNDFSLKQKIGEGASGHIYKATSQPFAHEDEIAIKLFKGAITSDGYPDDEIECCLQAGSHPNLVSVLAKVEDDSNNGLAMRLIPQGYRNLGLPPSLQTCTRDTFMAGSTLAVDDIMRVMLHMTQAVQHLHENQISHGDIYAHNTMVNDDWHVLFGDFGAATNLSVLPLAQQAAMAQIEVRALGCMLDDLLSLVLPTQQCSRFELLMALAQSALQSQLDSRPTLTSFEQGLNHIRLQLATV